MNVMKLLVFQIAGLRFAIPLSYIEMAIQVVEIRPLIKMPKYLLGVISMNSRIIPILDIRHLFGLEKKSVELSDQIVLVKSGRLHAGILADKTHRVIEIEDDAIIRGETISYGNTYLKGVVKLEDDVVLISDIDTFLSREELDKLEVIVDNEEEKVKKKSKMKL